MDRDSPAWFSKVGTSLPCCKTDKKYVIPLPYLSLSEVILSRKLTQSHPRIPV
jgi:hypothetical protein